MVYQRIFYLTALAVFLSACASREANFSRVNPFDSTINTKLPNADKVSIVFSNNVQGFVGPCGCAYNPKGGLDRRYEFLKSKGFLNHSSTVIVDSGNALFPNLHLDQGQTVLLKDKAKVILKAHQLMGISVANVGQLDLAAGLDFLRLAAPRGFPFISTNLRGLQGEPLFETKKILQRGSRQLVFLGVSEGAFHDETQSYRVLDPIKAVKQELKGIPPSSLVVVLSDMSLEKNEQLGRAVGRSVLILGARDLSSLELPHQFSNDLELRSQIQGQQWGVVDVSWKGKLEGWFSPIVGSNFKMRWDRLAEEAKELAKKPKSADLHREFESFARVQEDMEEYASKNLDSQALYDYRLYDLTTEFSKPNALTPIVKKYQ